MRQRKVIESETVSQDTNEEYVSQYSAPASQQPSAGNCCKDSTQTLIFFMIITMLISIASTWIAVHGGNILGLKIGGTREIVKQEILNNELTKVGGKSNYDIINEVQLKQIKQFIDNYKAQNPNWDNKPSSADQPPAEDQQGNQKPAEKKPTADLPEEKGKLELYIMSYCPFGEIAAKQVPALFQQFEKDKINFDVHYIADKIGEGFAPADFKSLHGTAEAEEDIRQICVKKDYGVGKLVEYMQARYKNANNYGEISDAPEVAYTAAGLDANKVNGCVSSGEGGKLLAEDIKKAQAFGMNASPTWVANNKNQFAGIEGRQIAMEFCKYNSAIESCKNIRIESSASNPNGTPKCNTN